MDTPIRRDAPSGFLRFFDSFLQEENIKWVLIIGTAILLGSSLMLVGNHWQSYTPVWKYLIALAYTGVIYAGSQLTYHRLLLRRTGTVLMGLTVLLLPVLFSASGWVGHGESWLALAPLFVATVGLAVHASGKIFAHFLRGGQPTFQGAYLLLCVAGTIAPFLPSAAAGWASSLLWIPFAAGSIKVSRHVFWLVEEHRQPRVLGFFPILLLGAAFLLVFTTNFAAHLEAQWFGLGCALVAVPILATTDAIARVFQQRTGDLVRPLPVAIITPLVIGLILSAAAMAIAATGLTDTSMPYAMVPTALLVAVSMALVARRTTKEAFVWATAFAALVAYNFSPVFFSSLARALVHSGAAALSEERLPYAFYGLTYLPVMIALLVIAVRGRGNTLVVRPARTIGTFLAAALLAVSVTHVKAIFPVSAALVSVFVAQAFFLRQRLSAGLANVAAVLALLGLLPFADLVLGVELDVELILFGFGVLAALQLGAGRFLDRRLDSPVFQIASLVVSLLLAAAWMLYSPVSVLLDGWFLGHVLNAAAILGLLAWHALHWRRRSLAAVATVFSVLGLVLSLAMTDLGFSLLISVATVYLVGLWLLGQRLGHSPREQAISVFAQPASLVGGISLSAVMVTVYLPLAFVQVDGLEVPWLLRLLTAAWAFDACRRTRLQMLGLLGWAGVFASVGAVFVHVLPPAALSWLPLAWVLTAFVALLAVFQLNNRVASAADQDRRLGLVALLRPTRLVARGVLVLAALGTLPWLTWPVRLAGLVAVAGLWLGARRGHLRADLALVASQWHGLAWILFLMTGAEAHTLWDVSLLPFMVCGAVAAVLAATLPILWPAVAGARTKLLSVHLTLFATLPVLSLFATLDLGSLSILQTVLAAVPFAAALVACVVWAVRRQEEALVWVAQGVAGLAVAYFAYFRVIHFGRGVSMFVVMGIGLLLWLVAHLARQHERAAVLSRPFSATAHLMPALTVCIAIGRHLLQPEAGFLGINSFGMFLAAGFYFWRGVERRRTGLVVIAAAISNLALVFLWRDLAFSDPQFFMIPLGISVLALTRLLRAEIPRVAREPLYYTGALIILVSPCFNILGGSWVHLFALMASSVAMVFVAIGLRLRALAYAGSAFLVADLVAMVIRGTVDNPSVLWVAGLALGAGVVLVGALAERNRELLLQRIRMINAELQSWG